MLNDILVSTIIYKLDTFVEILIILSHVLSVNVLNRIICFFILIYSLSVIRFKNMFERHHCFIGNSTLNSPEFGSFCSQPASGLRIIEGENSQMLLKFTSDGASSTRGFNITYMRLQRMSIHWKLPAHLKDGQTGHH